MVVLDPSILRHVATLSKPGPPVNDGEGGYTQSSEQVVPSTWRCKIESSNGTALRHFNETVVAQANYIFTGRFHPGVSAKDGTVVQWTDRNGDLHTGKVIDDDDVEGAGVITVAAVVEQQ